MKTQDARQLASELAMQKFELLVQVASLQEQVAALLEERLVRDENSPVAQIEIDRDCHIHHANPAAASLLGATRDALHGSRLDTFITTASLSAFRAFLSSIMTVGRHRCPDLLAVGGQGRHVVVDAVELPNRRILCSLVDVSGVVR